MFLLGITCNLQPAQAVVTVSSKKNNAKAEHVKPRAEVIRHPAGVPPASKVSPSPHFLPWLEQKSSSCIKILCNEVI
jgi:hypothetical protein